MDIPQLLEPFKPSMESRNITGCVDYHVGGSRWVLDSPPRLAASAKMRNPYPYSCVAQGMVTDHYINTNEENNGLISDNRRNTIGRIATRTDNHTTTRILNTIHKSLMYTPTHHRNIHAATLQSFHVPRDTPPLPSCWHSDTLTSKQPLLSIKHSTAATRY